MKNKKYGIFILLAILIAVGIWLGYRFYFNSSKVFLSEEEIIEQVKNYENVEVTEIQDQIFLDDKHVVIPVIEESGEHTLFYWEWTDFKWQMVGHNSMGAYNLWKLDEDDPESFYLIWNITPDPELSHIDLLLRRPRQYGEREGENYYYPEVQLTKAVEMTDKSYGVEQIPEDWAAVMTAFEPYSDRTFFSDNNLVINTYQPFEFRWVPYNEQDEVIPFGEYGISTGSGSGNMQFFHRIDEKELYLDN